MIQANMSVCHGFLSRKSNALLICCSKYICMTSNHRSGTLKPLPATFPRHAVSSVPALPGQTISLHTTCKRILDIQTLFELTVT